MTETHVTAPPSRRARLKRHQVLARLKDGIESGGIPSGSLLPGENELARTFDVSRGTIRAALSELESQSLITKQSGIGSFVTFDGEKLATAEGWAKALESGGVEMQTRTLRLECVTDAALALDVGMTEMEFVAIDRVRHVHGDAPVSLERSLVPARGILRDTPSTGLVGDSLTATLAAAGFVVARGEQWVSVVPLDPTDAEILERPVHTPFLQSVRISYDSSGQFVEKVVSLLAPERFRMHLTFPS